MISLGEIDKRGYQFVLGDREFVASQPGGLIELDLLHGHTSLVDGLDPPEAVIDVALDFGVDTITLSDHDTNEGNVKFGDMIRRRGGKSRHGYEYTAARFVGGEIVAPIHILAHQVGTDVGGELEVPKGILPPERFNEFIHEQGGVTTAAHPTFRRESLKRAEIERIQAGEERFRFDFIEVYNYGVSQVDEAVRLAGLVGSYMRWRGSWPQPGANEEARIIYEDHLADPEKHTMAAVGGPDNHRAEDATGVLFGHAVGTNAFTEARRGRGVIIARPPTLYRFREYKSFTQLDNTIDGAWQQKAAAQNAAVRSVVRT